MLPTRRTALAYLVTSACTRRPQDVLGRACHYLWSQQGEDGGWHSRTYGLLKSGQSLTPFVLNALLQVPQQAPAEGIDRAIAFLRRNTNNEGAVGKMDPLLYDYPNYATALTVQAFRRAGRPVGPLIDWLRTQQFTEAHGWKRDDPAYGAWGIGGEPRIAPNPGHVDLSMTRHVLQAWPQPESQPAIPYSLARVCSSSAARIPMAASSSPRLCWTPTKPVRTEHSTAATEPLPPMDSWLWPPWEPGLKTTASNPRGVGWLPTISPTARPASSGPPISAGQPAFASTMPVQPPKLAAGAVLRWLPVSRPRNTVTEAGGTPRTW